MKKYVDAMFEYLLMHERPRNVVFWVCWTCMLACAWTLPLWLYSGVIFFGALLCLHGMVDGYAASLKEGGK